MGTSRSASGKADSGESHGFADILPQDAGLVGPQKTPGSHLLRAFAGKGQAQVHIVEDGRQEQQQDDDGQEPEHLGVARPGKPVAAAGEEKGLIHAVCAPFLHFLCSPGGIVVLMQQGLNLGLHAGQVRILPHPEPGGVIADAVELLALPGSPSGRDIRDDVRRHEKGLVKIGVDALDGAIFFVHLDRLADLPVHLAGEGLTDQDIVLAHKVIEASFQKVILREHPEETGIGLDSRDLEHILPVLDDRLPEKRHVGGGLHLRDVHLQFFLVPIGQPKELVGSQHERALPPRRLMRHLVLLNHVRADQDDKRQAHRQSHRLDGGVQLVAGQEFQVGFHIRLVSSSVIAYICHER